MCFGETFLENPDLFPGRPSGELWGTGELSLRLAGVPIHLSGLAQRQTEIVAERFSGGRAIAPSLPAAPRTVTVRVFRAPPSDFRPQNRQPSRLDFDYGATAVRVAGWNLMARLERPPGQGAAIWTPDDGDGLFAGALENLLRALVAYRLLDVGASLIHSSAVVHGGGGLLLVGPSEAGKTTLWRLALESGHEVLCDDLNAIRERHGRLEIESTPFSWQEEARDAPPLTVTCSALLFLRQSREPGLRPLGRAETIGRLVSCAPFVNRDPYRSQQLFDSLTRLTGSVPAAELLFPREATVWRWLEGEKTW